MLRRLMCCYQACLITAQAASKRNVCMIIFALSIKVPRAEYWNTMIDHIKNQQRFNNYKHLQQVMGERNR